MNGVISSPLCVGGAPGRSTALATATIRANSRPHRHRGISVVRRVSRDASSGGGGSGNVDEDAESVSWVVAALSAGAMMASILAGDLVPPALAASTPNTRMEPTQTFMTGVPNTPAPSSRYLTAEEQATINLFQKNTPSVVYITNLAQRRDVFTLNIQEAPQGAGAASCGTTPGTS